RLACRPMQLRRRAREIPGQRPADARIRADKEKRRRIEIAVPRLWQLMKAAPVPESLLHRAPLMRVFLTAAFLPLCEHHLRARALRLRRFEAAAQNLAMGDLDKVLFELVQLLPFPRQDPTSRSAGV